MRHEKKNKKTKEWRKLKQKVKENVLSVENVNLQSRNSNDRLALTFLTKTRHEFTKFCTYQRAVEQAQLFSIFASTISTS